LSARLAIREKASTECPKCHKMIHVEIHDARGVSQALSTLFGERAWPARCSAQRGTGERIIFQRHVHYGAPREDGFTGEIIDRPHDPDFERKEIPSGG
jgi:hypothetical protein